MIVSFFPLDRGITTSSIWFRGSPAALKVWLYILLEADPSGFLEQRPFVIAHACLLDFNETTKALEFLAAPDPESRTPGNDGRRIEVSENGVRVLNYSSYRDKDYSTPRSRRWRETHANRPIAPSVAATEGNGKKRRERKGTANPLLQRPTPTPTPTPTENEQIAEAAPPPTSNWSKEACDDWISRFEGTAPGGPIGKHLKPLVDRHGWEVVRPAWKGYLMVTEPEFANPGRFAATFGTWRKAAPAERPAPPALPPGDPDAYQFFESMKIRLSGVISRESMSTWFRPTFGRAWEGKGTASQTLVLTVPSEQFAQQMRYFAPRLKQAADELGVTYLMFRTIVTSFDPALDTVHDGSIR